MLEWTHPFHAPKHANRGEEQQNLAGFYAPLPRIVGKVPVCELRTHSPLPVNDHQLPMVRSRVKNPKFLTPKVGTNRLSRNFSMKLPLLAVLKPTTAHFSDFFCNSTLMT